MAAPMLASYVYPTVGSSLVAANVPTLARMRKLNEVIVDITTDAGNANESPVTIAHNLQLPGPPFGTTDPRPDVLVTKLTSGMTVLADLGVTFPDGNSITLTKNAVSVGGASGLFRVYIKRPQTFGR